MRAGGHGQNMGLGRFHIDPARPKQRVGSRGGPPTLPIRLPSASVLRRIAGGQRHGVRRAACRSLTAHASRASQRCWASK
jgi:hypothetical protein